MKFDNIKVGKYYIVNLDGNILYKVISKDNAKGLIYISIIKDSCHNVKLRYAVGVRTYYKDDFEVKYAKEVTEEDVSLYML